MKNFKILSLALLAMLATTSCESKDDEDNDGGALGDGTVWVPDTVVCTQYGDIETGVFTYDSMNRIERVSEVNGGYYTEYEYLDGSIIITDSEGHRRVVALNNGLVTTYGNNQFSYNSNNELIHGEVGGEPTEFSWSGGLLVKAQSLSGGVSTVTNLSYSSNAGIAPACAKVINAMFLAGFADVEEGLWLNGYFGKVPTKPFSKVTSEARYEGVRYVQTITWSYSDINADGCPQRAAMTMNYDGQTDIISYSITWRKL